MFPPVAPFFGAGEPSGSPAAFFLLPESAHGQSRAKPGSAAMERHVFMNTSRASKWTVFGGNAGSREAPSSADGQRLWAKPGGARLRAALPRVHEHMAIGVAYSGGVSVYADLFRYRELFANLFRRDLQAKYRGSLLGLAWSLAHPLLLMAIYALVFSVLLPVVDIDDYPLFLLSGLAAWIFFSTSLQSASRSILDNANLVKKVRFPRQLVPLSIVGTHLVAFAVMIAVLIVVNAIVVPETRQTSWLALPLAAVFVAFVGGWALAVASANVVFRDVEHLLAALLLPWFFLTPVLYTFDKLPEKVRRHETLIDVLTYANVVTPPIRAIRDPLFAGSWPRAVDVAYLGGATLAALVLGALVFRRVDDQIAVEL